MQVTENEMSVGPQQQCSHLAVGHGRLLYSFSVPTIMESICVRSMTEVCKPDLLLSPVLDILEYNVDAEDSNLFEMRTVS